VTEHQKLPWQLSIPELKEVLVGELCERGKWVVVNVEPSGHWPVTAQKIAFRGELVWILPITQKHCPAVAMREKPALGREGCERHLMRFLSALSWAQEFGITVEGIGGGSMPVPTGRNRSGGFIICEEFELDNLPEPVDEKALIALALMREGRGLNHPAYAFLSFYRVLEAAIAGSRRRMAWINAEVSNLTDHRAKEALTPLRNHSIIDVGAHLYESGRCAIAHAREEPIIDPDDPSDARRLYTELPLMVALAQHAIEQIFGVETRGTIWKKHLYELAGFKKLLGAPLVDRIRNGVPGILDVLDRLPHINVRLRKRQNYRPLENLAPVDAEVRGRSLHLRYAGPADLVRLRLKLDFVAERLVFRFDRDLRFTDIGTADAAEAGAEVQRFMKEYIGNGRLEIVDAGTGALLSRKDAFIPTNFYLDHEAADAAIASWRALAQTRRK
jgi:hypothetical protein